jgi:hypothetical protein
MVDDDACKAVPGDVFQRRGVDLGCHVPACGAGLAGDVTVEDDEPQHAFSHGPLVRERREPIDVDAI